MVAHKELQLLVVLVLEVIPEADRKQMDLSGLVEAEEVDGMAEQEVMEISQEEVVQIIV